MEDKNPACKVGETPLHAAVKNGHFEISKLIIDIVEKKNPADDRGMTPLHYAAKIGNLEIFQLIVNLVEKMNPRNNAGETPLCLAAKNNHYEILNIEFQIKKRNHDEECIGKRKKFKYDENYFNFWPLNLFF